MIQNPFDEYLDKTGKTKTEVALACALSTPFFIDLTNGRNPNIHIQTLKQIHEGTRISYTRLIEYFCSVIEYNEKAG